MAQLGRLTSSCAYLAIISITTRQYRYRLGNLMSWGYRLSKQFPNQTYNSQWCVFCQCLCIVHELDCSHYNYVEELLYNWAEWPHTEKGSLDNVFHVSMYVWQRADTALNVRFRWCTQIALASYVLIRCKPLVSNQHCALCIHQNCG